MKYIIGMVFGAIGSLISIIKISSAVSHSSSDMSFFKVIEYNHLQGYAVLAVIAILIFFIGLYGMMKNKNNPNKN